MYYAVKFYVTVTSLSNCEIWLQIKPNLNVSLTFTQANRKFLLEIRRDSLQFRSQTYNADSWGIVLLYRENHVILASAISSQYA